MDETPLQRHMEIMLKELGMTPEQVANTIIEKTGGTFSPTNIHTWRRGKGDMTLSKARQINEAFPQFPVDWLRGFTEARTKEEFFEENWRKEYERGTSLFEAVCTLAIEGGGFAIGKPKYEIADGWPTFYFEISRGEKTATLTGDEYNKFIQEVSAYVETRLNLILERGAW